MSWDWAKSDFYGFGRFLDGRGLVCRGPPLGCWKMPGPYMLARFEQLHPIQTDARPRLLFYPTIGAHLPFAPVPPCVPDRVCLPSDDPFGGETTRQRLGGADAHRVA